MHRDQVHYGSNGQNGPTVLDPHLSDYYERVYDSDKKAWFEYLGQHAVPAHFLFAAFSAGWAARGHGPFLRRLVDAVAQAVVTPQQRRRISHNPQPTPPTSTNAADIAALVWELAEGGEAARLAAAQHITHPQRTANGGRSTGRSGPRSSSNRG